MPRDFELSVQWIYQAALRPGDLAVDVGAHVGRHTIPMAQAIAPAGKVFAFEPLPSCREALTNEFTYHHPHLRPNVEIFDCALSNYEGRAEFNVAVDAPWFSGLRDRGIYDSPTKLAKLPVRVRTLDALFLKLPALRYIKVDAEGGEYHIFLGGAECLKKFRPLVTFEFGANTLTHYGISCAEMGEFWRARDYRLYDVNGRALPEPEDFARSAQEQQVWDYAAIPAEDAALDELVRNALKIQAVS